MPIYYGKSKDGSDAKEFEGFYISSCGNFWGSEPFTKEREKQCRKLNNRSKWRNMINNGPKIKIFGDVKSTV